MKELCIIDDIENNLTEINKIAENIPVGDDTITRSCLHCSTEFTVSAMKKKGRKQIYCSHSCAVKYYGKVIRDNVDRTQKVATYYQQYPAKRFVAAVKQSAKQRSLSFALTEEWFKERLDKGVCEISGLPIRIKLYKKKDVGQRSFYIALP